MSDSSVIFTPLQTVYEVLPVSWKWFTLTLYESCVDVNCTKCRIRESRLVYGGLESRGGCILKYPIHLTAYVHCTDTQQNCWRQRITLWIFVFLDILEGQWVSKALLSVEWGKDVCLYCLRDVIAAWVDTPKEQRRRGSTDYQHNNVPRVLGAEVHAGASTLLFLATWG